jgi:hypothetical protein
LACPCFSGCLFEGGGTVSQKSNLSSKPGSSPLPADLVISRLAGDAGRNGTDPNHHLWRNGRLWWIAFTTHRGHEQERVRFSLKTEDVEQARRRRDQIFAFYEQAADCRISIRLKPHRRKTADCASGNAAGSLS